MTVPGAPDVAATVPEPAVDGASAVPIPDGGARAGSPEGAWQPSVRAALADASVRAEPAGPPRVRWAPGWRATGAAVTVLALAAGALMLRATTVPPGEPVVLPSPAAPVEAAAVQGAPATADGGPATADGAPDHVVVHVAGAVARPGVVRLPLGARVGDAILAVGGSGPDADLAGVNLARVVSDGEQVVVPVVGAAAPAAPAADGAVATGGLVDLNGADEVALQELPGVGPVLAGRIVQHRQERPFTTVDELDDVPGIGPALLADLRPRVRV